MNRDSPYQGLDAFAEADADFFFGRTRDVRLIVANLFASPFTVLYGPSGVGKTSVLHAGVLPSLRERGIAPIVLLSWSGDAVATLRRAVPEIDAEAQSGEGGRGRTVVVLDQFEDYFLDPADDQAFAGELASVVAQPDRAASVLVAIREDAVAKLDRFERRIPSLLDNVLRLDRLDRAAAREAILGPRDTWNARAAPPERFEVEDELLDAVLDSVSEPSGGIETALLQLVMRRLWEERGENGPFVLRRQTFDELGGLAGIVQTHVTGTLDTLPPDRQELAAAILEHLVTPSRLRIAQRTSDLAGFAGVGEDELRPLLEELSGDRVLRPVAGLDAHDSRYEVNHDSLADAVLGWRTRYVTAREVEAEHERARRRFRRLLAITVFASLAFAAMTALATYAWTQRQTARSEALSAEALRLLDVDPAAGLRKAREAVEVKSIVVAENALRAALARAHERKVVDFAGAGVTSVDFGPDGRLLTTDSRGRMTLRNAAGEVVRAFPKVRSANDAVFCPDSNRIAVAVGDGALLLAGGRRVRLGRDPGGLLAVSCSRNGARIATVTETAVRVYSRAGRELARIEVSPGFQDAALSPDGTLVVTVGDDGARVVQVSDASRVAVLEAALSSAAFAPDGSRVLAGGSDGDVRIWEFRSRNEPLVLRGHEQFVRDVAFSRDGSLAVSASTDRTARLWDAVAGEELAVLHGHANIVEAADFSGDNRTVATASEDGTVRLWDTPVLSILSGHRDAVSATAISADGTRIATAAEDVRVWDVASGRTLARFAAREVSRLHIAADGSRVLTVHEGEGSARLWSVARPRKPVRLALASDSILSAAFVPGQSTVVTGSLMGGIAFFDFSGRKVTTSFPASGLAIGTIAVAPEGDRLATAVVPEGPVAILDAATGDELARLSEPDLSAKALAWSSDGDLLATAETGGIARVWETDGGALTAPVLEGHVGPLASVSFDPDSELVVTAGADDTVRIWHVDTGTELVVLGGRSAAFASRSPTLVLAGPGPTARVRGCRPCGSISDLRRGG